MYGTANGNSRKRDRRRSQRALISDINVTPFVDVTLVLLIVFMVASPLQTVGVPLNLPQVDADSLPLQNDIPLMISVGFSGQIYFDEEEISLDDLQKRFQMIPTEKRGVPVYLRADFGVDYGKVMDVMGQLSMAGFYNIGLVTTPSLK
jgi:biopolymer transport protein TolR